MWSPKIKSKLKKNKGVGYKKLELHYRREAEEIRYRENREGGGRKFQEKISFKELKPMECFVHLNLLKENLENMGNLGFN